MIIHKYNCKWITPLLACVDHHDIEEFLHIYKSNASYIGTLTSHNKLVGAKNKWLYLEQS